MWAIAQSIFLLPAMENAPGLCDAATFVFLCGVDYLLDNIHRQQAKGTRLIPDLKLVSLLPAL